MDYELVIACLVGLASFFNHMTAGMKNVQDMKNKKKQNKKRRSSGKGKRRK